MTAGNRALGRNVYLYAASDPADVLSGFVLINGMTQANFHPMVEIILIFDSDYHLQDAGGTMVGRDDNPLQPGDYFVVTDGSFLVNNESWLVRTISVASVPAFRDAVRERDCRCIITGEEADADFDGWTGFEAAHVFPLVYEHDWLTNNYGRWIIIGSTAGGSTSSVQNGLLLRADIHALHRVS